MQEEFVLVREKIEEFINSSFLPKLNQKIDEQNLFLNKVRDLIKIHLLDLTDSISNEQKFYKEIENYNKSLLSLLKKNSTERKVPDFKKEFSELIQNYGNFIEQIDRERTEEQDDDRFKNISGDSFVVKVIKLLKKSAYSITAIPQRSSNLLRKLFHRSPKPLKRWKRIVYLRNLIQVNIIDNLLMKSFELLNELNMNLATSYQTIWMSEEKFNMHFTADLHSPDLTQYIPDEEEIRHCEKEFDSVLTQLHKNKNDIERKTRENLDEIFNEFNDIYRKAGTFEYSSRFYSEGKLEKSSKIIEEKYGQLSRGWDNTLFALFEDWKLNKDIYINEILEVQELYTLKKDITQKITDRIVPGLDEIKRVLIRCKTRIEDIGNSEGLRDILLAEKSTLSGILDGRLIIDTAELLVGQGIPETIHELEADLKTNIERTLVKRAIVKAQVYNREIRDTEIEYIEPKELIRFEILPDFLKDTQKLKATVIEQVDEVQKELMNIGQIADFNLESAIASIESADNEKPPENDPSFIAVDGLQRAFSKTEEIKSRLFEIQDTIVNSISGYISSFNKKILQLTQSDNILEIKLRIAKAKAVEKTIQYREKTIQSVKNLLPYILSLLKQGLIHSGNLYRNFRIRFGLEKQKAKISTEISDFLTESENAINKLPYVYQRLFRVEPLENEKFYEPREKEIDTIQLALSNWQKGYYAPAVLIGEKGSGITTTINFLMKKVTEGAEVIRVDAKKPIHGEKDLLKLLEGMLKENFKDSGEFIQYLNSTINKKIIIIENIHHLFVRRVGGLKTIKILFEIISATNRNVFWILSSNLYAWNYLERVMNISDYLSYIIKLSPFTDLQIVDIILKRHRVSGYNIIFEPSVEDAQSKYFQKLNDAEKQKYLEEKYFSELNRFARSNLSISLYFWMRSTREVKNDVITIGSLEGLDFSFLQDLSDEKIFTLYALLIHDGLTAEQHSGIFNQSMEKSSLNLQLLADDGIITKTVNGYIINPLLYRQTVSLLQSRNIIH